MQITRQHHSLAWLLQARELIRQEEALPEPEGEIEFIEVPDMRERWDCESVLSVSSNLYNHPGRIAEPCQRSAAGIRLSRKTGGPVGHLGARLYGAVLVTCLEPADLAYLAPASQCVAGWTACTCPAASQISECSGCRATSGCACHSRARQRGQHGDLHIHPASCCCRVAAPAEGGDC